MYLTVNIANGGYMDKERWHGTDTRSRGEGGSGVDQGGVEERGLEVRAVVGAATLPLVAAFGAVWLVWGSTYLAIAWAVETIPPLLLIGIRCAVAGALLYAWGRIRGGRRPGREDWKGAAVAGVLLFVTGQALLAWSETRIPSGAASLLIATEPLFIALLAWRGSPGTVAVAPTPSSVVALAAGFLGVGLVCLPGSHGALDTVGAIAAVAASLSWSLGIFRARRRSGIPVTQNAGMQLLAAGAVLLTAAVVRGDAGPTVLSGVSVRSLTAMAYLIVFGSLVAYGAYVWLLERVGPTRLSTHAYVNPLVAIGLGIALNGEPLTVGLILASVLILGSVALLLARPGRSGLGSGRSWRVVGTRVARVGAMTGD